MNDTIQNEGLESLQMAELDHLMLMGNNHTKEKEKSCFDPMLVFAG